MGFGALNLRGERVLFVASSGGHLAELSRIAPLTGFGPDSALVTFPSPQTQSVPWVDDVRYIPYVQPRDVPGITRSAAYFRGLFARERWDAVVSTGAAVAVPALWAAARRGIRTIYIESYARFTGPSATGRLLERISSRTELYTQHRSWESARWGFTGSVMDSLPDPLATATGPARSGGKLFVALGTIEPYRFDSLVDAVREGLDASQDVVWQLGCTLRSDLPGQVHSYLGREDFLRHAREADVVITHAGVGTALELVEMGHRPYVIPRRAHRGEHVDDHQVQVASDLAARGLAVTCDVSQLPAALRQRARPPAADATDLQVVVVTDCCGNDTGTQTHPLGAAD